MTSERKIAANRTNGRKSRGPRTAQGKSRASQNARRHGLTLPVMADPVLSQEAEAMARKIAGETADQDVLREAHAVAVAQIDLVRIRRAKLYILARHKAFAAQTQQSERATTAAPTEAEEQPAEHGSNEMMSSEALEQLIKIDRYERRTMSKRKFAIRRLDVAVANKPMRSNHSAENPS